MMSITGPAIRCPHFGDERGSRQAVLSLTTEQTRAYIALVKWRNQLLALFCLLAFAGVGVLYFQHWVIRKPFGIIVFVGEGLSPARLAPTRTYAGGAGTRLNLDSMPQAALMMNYSKDLAAPATAIATGERVANRALAINGDGKPIKSIIELAHERGRTTGLVTDTRLNDPTSAAF